MIHGITLHVLTPPGGDSCANCGRDAAAHIRPDRACPYQFEPAAWLPGLYLPECAAYAAQHARTFEADCHHQLDTAGYCRSCGMLVVEVA